MGEAWLPERAQRPGRRQSYPCATRFVINNYIKRNCCQIWYRNINHNCTSRRIPGFRLATLALDVILDIIRAPHSYRGIERPGRAYFAESVMTMLPDAVRAYEQE